MSKPTYILLTKGIRYVYVNKELVDSYELKETDKMTTVCCMVCYTKSFYVNPTCECNCQCIKR